MATAAAPASVYWTGADGNLYLKGANGVQNLGAATGAMGKGGNFNLTDNGFESDTLGQDVQATRIADPNAPAKTTTTGGTSTTTPLNTAAVNSTQQAIDSLGTESSVGNANIDANLANVEGGYDQEKNQNESDYNDNTVTNNNNFSKDEQNALLAAAQGKRGLEGTLASIGALSGDGVSLANRAVATGANADIGGARDTQLTNQTTLDKSINSFEQEDEQRRKDAETAAANSKTALAGSVAAKKQSFYQKMADLFSSADDNTNASKYLGLAGGLNGEIANDTAVAASPVVAKSAAYTPGTLASYLAGNGDMTVSVTGDGSDGSTPGTTGIVAQKKKDDEAATVPSTATA